MKLRNVAAVLAVFLAAGHPGSASAAPSVDPAAGRSSTVTLITGDRVTLTPAGGQTAVNVVPAPGRERMVFHRQYAQGRVQVIPDDALPALGSGQLDRKLFDVSGLIAQGYDDARRADLPLLVSSPQRKSGLAATKLSKKDKKWPVRAGERVWLDAKVKASLDRSVPMIGAPQAWASGVRGSGVKIAVLDTGYDPTHPDLAGVTEAKGFTEAGDADVVDHHGHGTHVASTIAGRGGQYTGVAPEASLLVGKVLGDDGSGMSSSIIAGMEWAANSGARVVNMSLGSDFVSDGTDPLSQAVNELTAKTGALFVVAAGNFGRDRSISAPAAADAALAVGSVTKEGALSDFSSRGPRIGDDAVKPEIAAPGTAITAARAAGTAGSGSYTTLSGTSMATPHVAGAAALLAQRNPGWRAGELKSALVANAKPAAGQPVYALGSGIVDVPAAMSAQVLPDVAAVNFGMLSWPPSSQPVQQKTITYRNNGSTPLTMGLTTEVTDAPAGLFAISPSSLTIPGGGTAQVTVTLTPSVGRPGLFGGTVSSRVDGRPGPRVLLGTSIEGEHHNLHIRTLGRDGTPASLPNLILGNSDGSFVNFPVVGPDGSTVRVPKGKYTLVGSIVERDDQFRAKAVINAAQPDIEVNAATEVVLDARKSQPVNIAVDGEPEARQIRRADGTGMVFTNGGSAAIEVDYPAPLPYSSIPARHPQLRYYTHSTWARPQVSLVTTGRFEVPVDYAINSARAQDLTAPVVDGGMGTPEEIARLDLRGKIVLLRVGEKDDPTLQVAAVTAAGAKAVVYPPQRFGIFLSEASTIPVLVAGWEFDRLTGAGIAARVRDQGASPFVYHLMFTDDSGLPAGRTYRATRRDLSTVDTEYAAAGVAGIGSSASLPATPVIGFVGVQSIPTQVPMRRVEYYTPGEWQHWASLGSSVEGGLQRTSPVVYERGRTYRIAHHRGVFAPRLDSQRPVVGRAGDTLRVGIPMMSGPGHFGPMAPDLLADSGTTTLRRDGAVIGASSQPGFGYFERLPAAAGTYELAVTAKRAEPYWRVSTEITSTWRFRSERTSAETPVALQEVGYDVPVDQYNAAPANVPFWISAKAKTVKVFGSTDDGTTWREFKATQVHGRWLVLPTELRSKQAVSLRVVATAEDGTAVDQTVIRAYLVC
ncbi:subtilisin family serine protease [Kibdelosporangium banguiense]|uniref:Subtilisin family serine protease n=1 Tax=Kibdelosporangium banguiense TaxID=1365924 RepID=A0ABS4TKM4_9PSEU|nr:S8 family serine peptidase [Kibdelosporangium banguiense]MBP2324936.1 subtilisin family serine protease [Kibdelosporangium banguiense]